jgi:hypothetical protein
MQQGCCIRSTFLPPASAVMAHFGEGQPTNFMPGSSFGETQQQQDQVRRLPLRAASISAPTVSGSFFSSRSRRCEGKNQRKDSSVGSDRKYCVGSNSETSIEHRLEISSMASVASSPSIPRSCKSRDSMLICFASSPDFLASTSSTHSAALVGICFLSLSLLGWIGDIY